MHKVIIKIGPGGKMTSEVHGAHGPCGQLTGWLDNLGRIAHSEDTPDAFEHVSTNENEDEKVNTGSDW